MDYINNKKFYEVICEYLKECEKNKEIDIPEYIGECFLKISKKLAGKGNFSGYTFKDEMICDGIENCIIAIKKFNPEKSNNPFSYFTQIIWFAFIRRIQKEKKQTYIKYKSLENFILEESLNDDYNQFNNIDIDHNEKMNEIIKKFEHKELIKKNKSKALEKFME